MQTVRVLAGDLTGYSRQLLQGFTMYRRALAKSLGLQAEVETYDEPTELAAGLARGGADAVVVMPHFGERAEDLCEAFAAAREKHPGRPIVFLDGHDQTSTPHFPVLPLVDRYIKSKMMRDPRDYQKDYLGGFVFADYYSRTFAFDLEDWHFGSIPDPAYADRIVPGWNFAVTPRCRYLARAQRLLPKRLARRRYELNLRLSLPARDTDREWYQDYRLRCRSSTEPLRSRLRVTNEDRLGQLAFLRELRESRIVFSPFGWGEVCWRDYEAVASGALLLKPDMSHVVTTPDIFVEGETYVKTRWDLSDIEEKVDYVLANPDEAQRIADNASQVLHDYFERGGFVDDVRRTLAPVLASSSD